MKIRDLCCFTRRLRMQQLRHAHRSGAVARGHTILELAFSRLLANPAVASVIAGATKPEQVEMNAAAANWELSKEELMEIDRLSPRSVVS